MSLTKIIYPDDDTRVISAQPNGNYVSGAEITSGDDGTSANVYRCFLHFNLTSIPGGSQFLTATLKLTIITDSAPQSRTKRVYRITSAWDATTVTWNTQPSYSGELGSLSFGTNDSGDKVFTLNADEVEKMRNGTYTNNGFAIITDTEFDDLYDFHSKEAVVEANRPQLTITYNPPVNRSQII